MVTSVPLNAYNSMLALCDYEPIHKYLPQNNAIILEESRECRRGSAVLPSLHVCVKAPHPHPFCTHLMYTMTHMRSEVDCEVIFLAITDADSLHSTDCMVQSFTCTLSPKNLNLSEGEVQSLQQKEDITKHGQLGYSVGWLKSLTHAWHSHTTYCSDLVM